jgi:hypothetical protein
MSNLLTFALREQLYAASELAGAININGLPAGYKDLPAYKNAKFTGDVFPYCGGVNSIDAGLLGMTESGITIAFRGTDGAADWLNDFLAWQTNSPYSKGKVHMGFLSSINNLEEPMLKKLDELLSANQNANINITGHSKGGALAALMGLAIRKKNADLLQRMLIVSFGAPRLGDNEFCSDYNVLHYRYESFLDLVPHLPFSAQENTLFSRESTFFDKADWLEEYLKLPLYKHTGKRLVWKQQDARTGAYLNLPMKPGNSQLETLNSFTSVLRAVSRTVDDPTLILYVHINDYGKIPADLLP